MNFNEYKGIEFKKEDIQEMNFLVEALYAQRLGLISNLIGQIVTMEAIQGLYLKYIDDSYIKPDLNKLIIISLTIGVIAGLTGLKISNARYEDLISKLNRGEINYSLQPNIDINIANTIGVLSNVFGIVGTLGLRNRENSIPIF